MYKNIMKQLKVSTTESKEINQDTEAALRAEEVRERACKFIITPEKAKELEDNRLYWENIAKEHANDESVTHDRHEAIRPK
jgi:hypothetical protein